MQSHRVQISLYILLFFLFGGSLLLLLYHLFSGGVTVWETYGKIYAVCLLLYTWYTFILLFIGDLYTPSYPRYNGGKISVIIPCYNEKPDLLRKALTSVIAAKGNKEILLVDDGSRPEIREAVIAIFQEHQDHPIKLNYFPVNRGKRHALHHAVKRIAHHSD